MKNITLQSTSTIKQALEIISKGAMKIAIIVDSKDKVIGTITDGDIRYGLLRGYTLEDNIENLYSKTPTLASVNDTKENIIQKAISKKLYQIPIVDNNGKLVTVEDLATLLKTTNKSNRVILMAGGLGTRLKPLTNDTPKPLLKVGNKPILETIINNFVKYGFVNITISVNYKSNMIKQYFQDGKKFGANIDYIEENKQLGTAGALSLIQNKPTEPFFVMNADLLTDVNFSSVLDFHILENAIATMCVREYDFQVPYGVIELNDSKITSIKEKPIYNFFVNAGIYVLSPKIFEYIPTNQFYDMPTLFDTLLKMDKKAISFPIHEYWMDIGQIEEYNKANIDFDEIF
jgi:dTDP-glucose pyrophosphorylase